MIHKGIHISRPSRRSVKWSVPLADPNWIERFRQHEVWEHLAVIQEVSSKYFQEDPNYQEKLDHIRYVVEAALKIKETTPYFLSINTLASISGQASPLQASLQTWENDQGQVSHLDQAYAYLDGLQDSLRVTIPSDEVALAVAAESINTSVNVVNETQSILKSLKDDLVAEIGTTATETTDRITNARGNLETLVTNLESQVTQLDAQVQANAATINTQATNQVTAFGAEVTERKRLFDQQLVELEGEFDAQRDPIIEQHSEEFTVKQTRATEILAHLEQLLTDSKGVVDATASSEFSKHYKEYADEQMKTANWMRRLAIGFTIAAFLTGIAAIFLSYKYPDESIRSYILKGTITISLIAGASYLAKESGNHRKEERESRSAQLRLLALEPFIARLDETSVKKLRLAAAQDLFITKGDVRIDDFDTEEDGAVV